MKLKKILITLILALLGAGMLLYCGLRHQDIPKLYFEGDIGGMYEKKDVRSISVRYEDGDRKFSACAALKVQGTSSLGYEKKNYTIRFYADPEHQQAQPVDVGWGAQSEYCLKANWIDRTHARNIVSARLAAQAQQKYGVLTDAPRNGLVDGFPVEIYSNGTFLGLYTFNIPKSQWQFAMDSENPNHIVVCGEGWEPANLFRAIPEDFEPWDVEVGEKNAETLEKLQALFEFVRNSPDEEFAKDFEKHVHLDAALNYYILVDLGYMADNLGKNMLLATYDGALWYPSLYDLDSTWGTDYTGLKLVDYEKGAFRPGRNLLFARMEEHFGDRLSQRYFELRQEILTKEHIMAEFEAFEAEIPPLVFVKEYIRWGIGYIREREDLPGAEYDQIEAFLDHRLPLLDEKYGAMG